MASQPSPTHVEIQRVAANGIHINVATAGTGPAVLLLHGWPHTWQLWTGLIPHLAPHFRVIAPDLRGLGGSTHATEGYDAVTLAADAAALLDAVGEEQASIVAIDAGVPVASALALDQPARIERLVLMEALLPGLPGAEALFANGPPWWFGFHATPGLAETVLVGHEPEYIDWFLNEGTLGHEIEDTIRHAFQAAYTGSESLRCGFEYYRATATNAAQLQSATRARRLTMPTMAIGAATVGDALHRQLEPIADHLTSRVMSDCGHIIPLHRPQALIDLLMPFLTVAIGLAV
ncbi:alpha/beta fold hydrolase [Jatrophihabitans lederbergiae]|uniref:Alpha/beta hydrolase n=1 Tax=Jatrophihabitans lederbergiae TaxID=3075547 RepID=A0ABU2JEB2_9ACTN|nr:alpha/beta hydrolase [Jatrophihabitans sp. DSM 44399]MDT0263076.1 alpha/beta hydrolase [Jatrophihabitans sp. DSM 44399]